MTGTDKITITLTRDEWRVLAVAASKVKGAAFINPIDKLNASRLALIIATLTGQE